MPKLPLNLSRMSQPCPLQAAMVVSEMKDRLSPNMAPPTTVPTHRATLYWDAWATSTAMGAIKVMVPTEVPMAVETKQATTNSTATANRGGIRSSIK